MKTLLVVLACLAMLGCSKPEPKQELKCSENYMGWPICADARDRVLIPVDKWAPVKVVV